MVSLGITGQRTILVRLTSSDFMAKSHFLAVIEAWTAVDHVVKCPERCFSLAEPLWSWTCKNCGAVSCSNWSKEADLIQYFLSTYYAKRLMKMTSDLWWKVPQIHTPIIKNNLYYTATLKTLLLLRVYCVGGDLSVVFWGYEHCKEDCYLTTSRFILGTFRSIYGV